MITAGIDIGSRNTKLVVFDSISKTVLFSSYTSTDINAMDSVDSLYAKLDKTDPKLNSQISKTAFTGYGRHLPSIAHTKYSEIICHAKGIQHFFPNCHSIIDIGGQDSKVIALDNSGRVLDFVMNDKCAAGTGRFLEMTAMRIGCGVDKLSEYGERVTHELILNSTCVVFAESEIVGFMALGETPGNIIRAIHSSIAHRVSSQLNSLVWEQDLVFTGGVAYNDDLRLCIERILRVPVLRSPEPEISGALGAAILVANEKK